MSNPKPTDTPFPKQILELIQPKNLAKSLLASGQALPLVGCIAGPALEMASQLEDQLIDNRINCLEGSDAAQLIRLQKIEKAVVQTPAPLGEWPNAVSEFLNRHVEIAVVYDGGFIKPEFKGREFVVPIGHGCAIGDNYVLTCPEVLRLVNRIAAERKGKAVIVAGMVWHFFSAEPEDEESRLVLCKITSHEEKDTKIRKMYEQYGVADRLRMLPTAPVKGSVTPWMGQEIGILHAGEAGQATETMKGAEDVGVQFDTATVSHLKKVGSNGTLKTFVTSVIGSNILRLGSSVFGRDGTLYGIVSDVERHEHDFGYRAVVKSLLGHPRFTHWKKDAKQ